MSYGPNIVDGYRQVGIYTGRILKARQARGLARSCNRASSSWSSTPRPPGCLVSTVPPMLLARADEVIE